MNPLNNPFLKVAATATDNGDSNSYSNIFDDFYGKRLRIVLAGSLRGEKRFGSFDHLIKQINFDIRMGLFIHSNTINGGGNILLSNDDDGLDNELRLVDYRKLSSAKSNFIDNYLTCIDDGSFLGKYTSAESVSVSAEKNVFATIANKGF